MKVTNGKHLMKILGVCTSATVLIAATLLFGGSIGTVHAAQPVAINATNFPDDVFRSVISNTYDYNGNGYLEQEEIERTMNIVCEGKGVNSVKGIEFFTEIQGLWVMDNNISVLDVSKNTHLHGIWCSGNPISYIDLSHNPELEWIYCFDCNLTSLDVSHNPDLAFIECNTNPIKYLDITNNPKMEHLTCGSCDLESLDLSNSPKLAHLDIFRNPRLKSLDVSSCPKMKRLDIWDNPLLGSIDVSNNPELQYYNCSHNNATSVDVSHNPELTKLICSYNDLGTLDLSNNPKLSCLYCECSNLDSLDLTHNPRLYYLQGAMNNYKSLNIGMNPFLVKTFKEAKRMDDWKENWHGYEWIIDYGGDTSTGGDNIFLLWLNADVNVVTSPTLDVYDVIPWDDCTDVTDTSNLMTREEFMYILYDMAGKPGVGGLNTRFKDIEKGSYYEDAVKWGEANAIAVGYPHLSYNTFGSGTWITRQDVVFMLMRYSEVMNLKRAIDFGRSDDYMDYFDVDYEHWEAVCWSAKWHILEGKGGATKATQRFDPFGRATRSEIQQALNNLYEQNSISGGYPVPAVGPTPAPRSDSSQIRAFVERFYRVVLGREGEEKGIKDWCNRLISREKAGADIAKGFAMSEEFKKRNLSNEDYVRTLYRAFFDREPDEDGFKLWTSNLAQGQSREAVLAGFVNSQEFKKLCARYGIDPGRMDVSDEGNKPTNPNPNTDPNPDTPKKPGLKVDASEVDPDKLDEYVERLYTQLLGRPSDPEGKKFWREIIINGKDANGNYYDAAIVARKGFIESEEYKSFNKTDEEFITDLYHTFLDREPEPEGFAFWLDMLQNKGYSKQEIIDIGFGCSEEFKKILISYGFKIIEQ